MRNRAWLLVALIAVACIAACNSSSGGTAPPQVIGPNLAPFFAGLKGLATAGGGTVRLCWRAASDDSDAPFQIRYRIYISDSPGSQNVLPALTTAPGQLCITVNVPEQTRSFFVVRAVDTEGREDENEVELSITPIPVTQVIYVDSSNKGGTGTFTDPYASLQDGVEAAETLAGGGIVLVARGLYNEAVFASVASASPLYMFGGFPNWNTFGGASAPREVILDSMDAEANQTMVDGTGITQFSGSGRGLIHVANNGRQTAIGGFWVREAEEAAIWGVEVDLEISCCTIRDPDINGNTTNVGIHYTTNTLNFDNYGAVVGNDISEFNEAGVNFTGTTRYMEVSNNRIFQDPNEEDGVGIDNEYLPPTLLAGPAPPLLDPASAVVPSGGTLMIRIETNDIRHTDDHGINLDFSPEAETVAGTLQIEIVRNRIEFIDSDAGIDVDDLNWFGDGGSASLLIDHNHIISTSNESIDMDFSETQTITDGTQVDGPTTVTITNNWLVGPDDGVVDIDGFIPPPGGTASFTFNDNYGALIESTAFEFDSFDPTGPGPADGRLEFIMLRNRMEAPNNGDMPELDLDNPPGAKGLLSVRIEDNFVNNADGSPIMDIDIDSEMGTDPPGTVYNQSVDVHHNVLIETIGDDEEAHIEVHSFVNNGTTTIDITHNSIAASSGGVEIRHDDDGDDPGQLVGFNFGSTTIQVNENNIFSTGEQGIRIEADLAGGGLTLIDLLHNRIACEDDAIDMDLNSGNAPNGRAHVNVFNTRIDAASDNEWFDYDDDTDPSNGEAVYLYAGQNTFGFADEDSEVELDIEEHSMILFANNFVGFGEVDSEDGIDFDANGENPGLVYALNNLIAFNPGDGVDIDDNINVQFINNTVTYNGAVEGGSGDFGIQGSGDAQPWIHNSIVDRNGEGDLRDDVGGATYSLVGDEDPPMGWGNITGDPLFNLTPVLFAFDINFRLRPGSPAANAGDPDPDYNNRDGTRNDMGAYGGPGADRVGSLQPDDPTDMSGRPAVPLLAIGLAVPFDDSSTLVGLRDMHAGAPLRAFGPGNPVSIVFTQPLAATDGIAFSADGAAIAGTFALSNGDRIATFTPNAPVAPGSVVRVAVTSTAVPYWNHFGVLPPALAEAEGGATANDTTGTAESIPGTPSTLNLNGDIFAPADVDFYSFTASAGERIQGTVVAERLTPESTGNFTLMLIDTDGTTVLATNSSNAGRVNGSRRDPFVDYTVRSTGTYYLSISSTAGTGDYALQWFVR